MTELTIYNDNMFDDAIRLPGPEADKKLFGGERHCAETLLRQHNAAMAMLRYALQMIHHNESRIAEQQARITQLEKLAVTDELTGLLNRRGFYTEMEREIARINRGKSCGGVLLLIDMDRFKQINDTYGHAAGDACLKLVAENLKGCIRREDAAARLGGDEFAVLLSGADADKGPVLASRIAGRINRLKLRWAGVDIPVHASVGVRVFEDAGDGMETIFNDADMRLYDDKRADEQAEDMRCKAVEHVA